MWYGFMKAATYRSSFFWGNYSNFFIFLMEIQHKNSKNFIKPTWDEFYPKKNTWKACFWPENNSFVRKQTYYKWIKYIFIYFTLETIKLVAFYSVFSRKRNEFDRVFLEFNFKKNGMHTYIIQYIFYNLI